MSDTNRFGRIVTPGQIERAMAATVALWIDEYLEELARIEGYGPEQIERPKAIVTRSDMQRWSEEQIPAVVVSCGPMDGEPQRHSQGMYDAAWVVNVAAVVADQEQDATRRLALTWVTALRTLIGQHKMLKSPGEFADGLANYSRWRSESYDEITSTAERTLGAGSVTYSIGIENVLTEQAGPRDPSGTPWVDPGPWPEITNIEINVESEPLEAAL